MCGIAGLVLNPSYSLFDLRERVNRMCAVLTHRGPDDAGTFFASDGRVGFGNRRLAIRDLSPLGHMPMLSDDGNLALTYNGEIYNADELRAELERAGGAFRSTSDTEVILRGYETWGEKIFARLRGIFALAFYDARANCVLLARDHLGVKPLYYARTDAGLLFASEIKALRASQLVSHELDAVSIVAYLELGCVPTPRTIFQNIHALEPATLLRCALDTMESRTTRYWAMPTHERAAPRDVVAETRAALFDAVRSQLVSDVPLGAFLSGGLDSGSVVTLMRQATNGTLRTCAMVFEEAEFSEAPYARAVAEQVGAEHFERVITAQDVLNEMPRILWALDQPSLDGVNSYFVSQTARQAGLTVALSGLGGDELFGGYPTFYNAPKLSQRVRRVQQIPFVTALARRALKFAPRYAKLAYTLTAPDSPASAYLTYRGLFAPNQARTLVKPEIWDAAQEFNLTEYVAARASAQAVEHDALSQPKLRSLNSSFAWTSRAELGVYTLSQLLRDTDAMSMAHSLEVRVPLLDHLLVEKIISLPDDAKRDGGIPKSLLLKAMGNDLPALVRERKTKMGFTFPFARWLRGDLKNFFAQYPLVAQSVLEPSAVTRVIESFERGQTYWSRAWSLYVLNAWLQENSR